MREILFKAKRQDNGEWVQGYLCVKYFQKLPHGRFVIQYKPNEDAHKWTPEYMTAEIDPETLSQYTGLKDKNGVKIFENDVVMFETLDYGGIKEVGNVIFYEGSYCIKYISTYWGEYDGKHDIHRIGKVDEWQDMGASGKITYTYYVCGNRFDNPELLGGAK